MFFTQYPPDLAQEELKRGLVKVGKFVFNTNIPSEGRFLFLATPGEEPREVMRFNSLGIIKDLKGNKEFEIFATK